MLHFLLFTLLFCVSFSRRSFLQARSEPDHYNLSFDTSDNPLGIKVVQPYSKNYFITIGDWGANTGDGTDKGVQQQVANKLKEFVKNQTDYGMNLLFISAVGDNFYWTGQDGSCSYWNPVWEDMYGDVAKDYVWFPNMGNHDWGNDDKYAMCAWNNPYYTDPDTGIPYASNQLSKDKKGCAPDNYYFPDFSYYYTIDELDFELIALEESYYDCPGGIGGDSSGSNEVWDECGGSSVGCGYLDKIKTASENMMYDRAANSKNSNFLLQNHYPSPTGSWIYDNFKNARPHSGSNDIIVSIYGHVHTQSCDATTKDPYGRDYCNLITTGGGGGCCYDPGSGRGFFVMQFDDNKHMYQPLSIYDSNIYCTYPCGASHSNEQIEQFKFRYCCIISEKEKEQWFTFNCTNFKC